MPLVLGAGGDPLPEGFDLFRRQRVPLGGRRHPQVRVGLADALQQRAGVGIAGDDRPFAAVEFGDGSFTLIEPQPGLQRVFIRPVTLEALLGQHRLDVTVEIHLGRTAQTGGQRQRHDENQLSQESHHGIGGTERRCPTIITQDADKCRCTDGLDPMSSDPSSKWTFKGAYRPGSSEVRDPRARIRGSAGEPTQRRRGREL